MGLAYFKFKQLTKVKKLTYIGGKNASNKDLYDSSWSLLSVLTLQYAATRFKSKCSAFLFLAPVFEAFINFTLVFILPPSHFVSFYSVIISQD